MKNAPFSHSADRAEEHASLWAARLHSGPLTSEQRAALQAWLQENPAHRTLLDEFCEASADFDGALAVLQQEKLIRTPETAASSPTSSWRWLTGLAVVGAATAAVALIFFFTPKQTLHTQPGQRQNVTLADGSVVSMNGHTTVEVALGRRERRVRLEAGEALFTVAKDASRPFYVTTSHGVVRVTGTVFNIRADAPEGEEVTVLEGTVQVAAKENVTTVALHANDQTLLTGETSTVHALTPEALRRVTAWREGRIVFAAESLRGALERFCWYHGCKLDVSSKLDGLALGGQYDLDDLNAFLDGIEDVLPIKVLRENGYVRVVPR